MDRLTLHIRRTNAGTRIQKSWRGYNQRQKYLHVRRAIVTIQAFTRGTYGRRHFTKVLREARATTIQKTARGWLAKKKYQKTRKAIILIQCCTRRMYAKKELKKLKVTLFISFSIQFHSHLFSDCQRYRMHVQCNSGQSS